MDTFKIFQEYVARNDATIKKIHASQAKILFKRDLQLKNFQRMIAATVEKLNKIYEMAENEVAEASEYRRNEFMTLEKACVDRATKLRHLFVDLTHTRYSKSELETVLAPVEADLTKANRSIDSLSHFDLVISPTLSNLSQLLTPEENLVYVRTCSLFPQQVEAIMSPSTAATNNPTCTTLTLMAIPARADFLLHHSLTATLEKLDSNSDNSDGRSKCGVILPQNDETGVLKINFAPVPSIGEYLIQVLLYGVPVKNSPIEVHLTGESTSPQVLASTNEDQTPVKNLENRNHTSNANGDKQPPSNTSPSRPQSPSMLSALASRARQNSRGTIKQKLEEVRDPIGFPVVAVASKRPIVKTATKQRGEKKAVDIGTLV